MKRLQKQQVLKYCNMFSLPLQFLACFAGYLVIEAISRHSLFQAVDFLRQSPWAFLYNTFLIFTTSTIVYLFKRRVFARIVVALFWLILGCINGGVLACRVTPFTGPDLKLLGDAFKIMNKYLSTPLLILAVAAIIAIAVGLVFLFIKGPKYQGKVRYIYSILLIAGTSLLLSAATNLAHQKRVLSSYFGNIAFAYQDYGYPYCLATTIFNTGINCPNGYSEELMKKIVKSSGNKGETDGEQNTNIVFLQLESFFDPTRVNFLNVSEDPIPYFRKLMEEYSSGYYRVPSVGAGTANTEFETITGMSLHYFGPGEYPYKSILKEENCESIPYVLKGLGYTTHAIHNNEANFYARKSVFPRLGFDSFTSEEYMADISDTTENGWVKDHILTDAILDCLNSSKGPDYVYTISVQGHGDYPTEPVLDNPLITVSGAESREKNDYSWEYYVNQLREMDDFVRELTEALAAYPEPVVLVMYGDHLPTMGLQVEDVKNRYLFQTEYVIWDNFGMDKKDKNLAAYQIGAEVLDRLGIHEGTIVRYHQARKNTKNYQVDLEALQYDILYGERYVYGGVNPYEKTEMRLGVRDIILNQIRQSAEDEYYFEGENFTASSYVEINGELQESIFINNSTLLLRGVTLEDGDEICIAQQSNSSTHRILSRGNIRVYDAPKPEITVTPTPEATVTPKTTVTPEAGAAPAPEEP